MIRIVVGGQMDKQLLARIIENTGKDKVQVSIKSDIEAALAVQMKTADYYFGACATGAGGALAIAIGLLGPQSCASISIPGKIMSETEIRKAVQDGKVAFGFVNNDAEKVIPMIMDEIFKK